MDKLTEIMADKRREIAPLVRPVFVDELTELNRSLPKPPSFLKALQRPDGRLAVIAEIKRRSPSAGAIKENASAVDQARRYREAGASAILIIVRALTDDEITALHTAATAAGLDALFEIHNEEELHRAVQHQAKIIGVNNRDLAIFKTDIGLSERLIPLFPKDVVAVSESGFSTAADAARARAAGAHALLVGEALMKAADPGALIAGFQRHD